MDGFRIRFNPTIPFCAGNPASHGLRASIWKNRFQADTRLSLALRCLPRLGINVLKWLGGPKIAVIDRDAGMLAQLTTGSKYDRFPRAGDVPH